MGPGRPSAASLTRLCSTCSATISACPGRGSAAASGLCGACFVLIDGQARSSCDFPVWAAEGKDVTTVEGLADGGTLHAVQQALIDEQAAQCGYCTSGMIVSAVALLRRNPSPSEAEVREALDGNLCRCGTHRRIVRAVLARRPPGQRRPGAARGRPDDTVPQPGRQPGAAPLARLRPTAGHHPPGQGRVRPGRVDRPGPDRGRRTRRRAGPCPGRAGQHGHQPGRGRDLREPVHRGVRRGAAPGLRAGPGGGAGRGRRQAGHRPGGAGGPGRRDPAPPTAPTPGSATGRWTSPACWTGRRRGHRRPSRPASGRSPAAARHGSTCPTRSPAAPGSCTTWCCRAWCSAG